jgi:hypothetical protein
MKWASKPTIAALTTFANKQASTQVDDARRHKPSGNYGSGLARFQLISR